MSSRILVTGGAGYIGSHSCVALLNAGFDVVVYDNLTNSYREVVGHIETITAKKVSFVEGDIREEARIAAVLRDAGCDAVIHFAGLKAVGESAQIPLDYYDNNVAGTLSLLRAMGAAGVKKIIFSSSATVYGDPVTLPIREDARLTATNPYGRTKLFIEEILRDLFRSDPTWRISILRYFNPAGAHESGLLGENPRDIPNNLMPIIARVAAGGLARLQIYGADYPTADGTGMRDYIHVLDLAEGHVSALMALGDPQCVEINLGTGKPYSVREMIAAFERASGRAVPHELAARRPGDVAVCYANPEKAARLLGWRAQRGLDEMCRDVWRFQESFARR